MRQVTVSLRNDEDKAIKRIMDASNLKRHQVIKFAIRRFLFPTEKVVGVNGEEIIIKDQKLLSDTAKAIEIDKGFSIQPRQWDFKKETEK